MTQRLMNSKKINDLIGSLFIVISIISVTKANNSVTLNDHCTDRRFVNSLNTTFMQFTKETVDQEYAVEGDFKGLHCCAKGYRSIEWLKDGKSYPWSSEDTSSLIVYPAAENQTIYTRKASKIDEGKYTCVLRNATHKLEHHIELKLQSSSPDIPLATFKPVDQFANVDGSARFYCEAFIGKKALPNIAISIKWYHLNDENKVPSSNDNDELIKEEVVYREDEQIIGSYLTIMPVTLNHYGRYLCRIEIGNSPKHRLDMSASLINALHIEVNAKSILTNPIFLGSCAAIIALITFFLILHFTKQRWISCVDLSKGNKGDVNFNISSAPLNFQKFRKSGQNECDDMKIMIDII